MNTNTVQKPPAGLSLEMLWNLYQELAQRVEAIASFDEDYAENSDRIDWARIAAEAKERVAEMKNGNCLGEESLFANLEELDRMIDAWQPPQKQSSRTQETAVV